MASPEIWQAVQRLRSAPSPELSASLRQKWQRSKASQQRSGKANDRKDVAILTRWGDNSGPPGALPEQLRTHELGSALAPMGVTELVEGAMFLGLDGMHALATRFLPGRVLRMARTWLGLHLFNFGGDLLPVAIYNPGVVLAPPGPRWLMQVTQREIPSSAIP